jgi:hypothetical protein
MPLFDAQTWESIIGWREVAIGVTFLFKDLTLVGIQRLCQECIT